MRTLLGCLLPVLLLLPVGCPQAPVDDDPNTPADTGGAGTGGGGTGNGDNGASDDGDDDFVGPPVPGGDPNEPPPVTTRNLTIQVNFFDTLGPAAGAEVSVRASGFPATLVCTETADLGGQALCLDLEPGNYTVTATVTDGNGFPQTGTARTTITEGLAQPSVSVLIVR